MMKKLFLIFFTFILSLSLFPTNVSAYWDFTNSIVKLKVLTADWNDVKNYLVKFWTASQRWKFVENFTNEKWEISTILNVPIEIERWEYNFLADIGLSRLIITNPKILTNIVVYYDVNNWYIKRIEWVEPWNYVIQHKEKDFLTGFFPLWTFKFWFTDGIIIILAIISSYLLLNTWDQRYLRMRNSTFSSGQK